MCWRTCCFLLGSSAACGGFNTAGLLPLLKADAGSPDPADTMSSGGGAGAGGAAATDDGSALLDLGGQDAGGTSSEAAPRPATDASLDSDAAADSTPADHPPKGSRDGEADDAAFADGPPSSGPCAELTACCGRLVIAPPLAAACYAPTVQGDAGNASSCVSTLVSFRDAGLCP